MINNIMGSIIQYDFILKAYLYSVLLYLFVMTGVTLLVTLYIDKLFYGSEIMNQYARNAKIITGDYDQKKNSKIKRFFSLLKIYMTRDYLWKYFKWSLVPFINLGFLVHYMLTPTLVAEFYICRLDDIMFYNRFPELKKEKGSGYGKKKKEK